MNFAMELWGAYLDRHCPRESPQPPQIERPAPGALLRLIWPLLEIFRPHLAVLSETPYSEAFEEDADHALASVARDGNFSSWKNLSAGTWAVLWDRAAWSVTALAIEDAAGAEFTIPLPLHAAADIRAKAAFLFLLAGPGRDPSGEWQKQRRQRSPGAFLEAPPWRH